MRDVTADAPGRVNLIGEHTDYHQGFVLPTVIPQRTRVRMSARDDRRVRATSRETGNTVVEFVIGAEAVTDTWVDYVQGVTHALRSVTTALPGFDVAIESDVPLGSGLSSSAALAVSLLRALRDLYSLSYDDVELARIAQRVETEFVGAPIGIMDQMACSLARDGEALFLDTRSLSYQRVVLPPGAELVVINSGVRHQHAGGEYATRRRESFEAAARLDVEWLRDVSVTQLHLLDALPDPLDRRARHIVTENQRVHDTVAAFAAADLERVGTLFDASHRSMRDDYETSTPEIDSLVNLGRNDPDVFGARLTGGGFGGSVVMLVRADMGNEIATRILAGYHARSNQRGSVLIPER
ncbi:MAG: galactokinase [Acidobacteria bacterium]|nr:galactokinase [Acidobacteriota bacterium]